MINSMAGKISCAACGSSTKAHAAAHGELAAGAAQSNCSTAAQFCWHAFVSLAETSCPHHLADM